MNKKNLSLLVFVLSSEFIIAVPVQSDVTYTLVKEEGAL